MVELEIKGEAECECECEAEAEADAEVDARWRSRSRARSRPGFQIADRGLDHIDNRNDQDRHIAIYRGIVITGRETERDVDQNLNATSFKSLNDHPNTPQIFQHS